MIYEKDYYNSLIIEQGFQSYTKFKSIPYPNSPYQLKEPQNL